MLRLTCVYEQNNSWIVKHVFLHNPIDPNWDIWICLFCVVKELNRGLRSELLMLLLCGRWAKLHLHRGWGCLHQPCSPEADQSWKPRFARSNRASSEASGYAQTSKPSGQTSWLWSHKDLQCKAEARYVFGSKRRVCSLREQGSIISEQEAASKRYAGLWNLKT